MLTVEAPGFARFQQSVTLVDAQDVEIALAAGWKMMANTTLENSVLTANPLQPTTVGKHPVGTPQHIVNFWTSYDIRAQKLRGLKIGGGLTYRDKMFGNTANTVSVPSYVTPDTVASYTGEKWTAQLGFRNLTNTRYFTAANGGGGFVGEPFSVFGEVKHTFGGK